jgi:hypothetical protein
MKHLHHFKFNLQGLPQCSHCNQYLPKSNNDFGANYQDPINSCCCCCHCACCQQHNHSQRFQMREEDSPFLQINEHKLSIFRDWLSTGVKRLIFSLLYVFVLFLFFCFCLSFISCRNQKSSSDFQNSVLGKNKLGQYGTRSRSNLNN